MSRQQLAHAVNAHAQAGCRSAVEARYIGRRERGEHRWPFEPYRRALREVLGKATNADLGFLTDQGNAQDPEVSPEKPGANGSWPSPARAADPGCPVSVTMAAGLVIMARAAAVRVTVLHAETVTAMVHHHDTAGAVAVLAGPVELIVTPSGAAWDRLAAGPGMPSTAAGLRQVYRLSDRRAR
ncbi:hypothetical protein [Micromonospora haikouensis]|uniref:hypothetical protein n=1 Tax=Micromonospora haikouensis TaxID=686309 RepID=UPI003D75BEB1